jgi:hypothetical protein
MLFRARRIRTSILFLVAAVLFYFAGPSSEFRYLSYAMVGVVFIIPWALYRGIVRVINQSPQYTDPKTITFSSAGVVVVGPKYKSELAWSMFKAFSEDSTYFYLHLSDTGFDSVVPKSAFSAEQQEEFRSYASALNGKQ